VAANERKEGALEDVSNVGENTSPRRTQNGQSRDGGRKKDIQGDIARGEKIYNRHDQENIAQQIYLTGKTSRGRGGA